MADLRPFEELTFGPDATGVLWAINRVLFHPRGFALTIDIDEDGKATGWYLQGDGTEVWTFAEDIEDEAMRTFEAFLNEHRPETP